MEQFEIPNVNLPNNSEFYKNLPNLSTQYVLGKRMEIFLKEILKLSKNHEILINNVQIFRDKLTLGEIDYIIHDLKKGELIHLELVFKFYIYDPSYRNEFERWIGPNKKDSLQQKINKLNQKQFPLLQEPETEETLAKHNIVSSEIFQKVCFKANLFVPRSLINKQLPIINNDCIVGYYIHSEEFKALEFQHQDYYIPRKQEWAILPEHNSTWYSYAEIQDDLLSLLEKKRSPLLFRRIDDQTFERLFVVWW